MMENLRRLSYHSGKYILVLLGRRFEECKGKGIGFHRDYNKT